MFKNTESLNWKNLEKCSNIIENLEEYCFISRNKVDEFYCDEGTFTKGEDCLYVKSISIDGKKDVIAIDNLCIILDIFNIQYERPLKYSRNLFINIKELIKNYNDNIDIYKVIKNSNKFKL